MACVRVVVRYSGPSVQVHMGRSVDLERPCETGWGLVYIKSGRLVFILLFDFRGLLVFFLFLQLNGNTPEELSPRNSFLISRSFIIRKFPPFTTNKQNRLTVPIPCKVEGDSSWNSERKFWAELEKSVTEVCRDEILTSSGVVNGSYVVHVKHGENHEGEPTFGPKVMDFRASLLAKCARR